MNATATKPSTVEAYSVQVRETTSHDTFTQSRYVASLAPVTEIAAARHQGKLAVAAFESMVKSSDRKTYHFDLAVSQEPVELLYIEENQPHVMTVNASREVNGEVVPVAMTYGPFESRHAADAALGIALADSVRFGGAASDAIHEVAVFPLYG